MTGAQYSRSDTVQVKLALDSLLRVVRRIPLHDGRSRRALVRYFRNMSRALGLGAERSYILLFCDKDGRDSFKGLLRCLQKEDPVRLWAIGRLWREVITGTRDMTQRLQAEV